MTGIEIFGYTASGIIALSLTMKNINKLRWWNLLGASLFSIYGLMIHAIPVFILDGYIALVNVWYLRQLYMVQDTFELLPVDIKQTKFLDKFLHYYHEDILRYMPDFSIEEVLSPENQAYFILRDMLPVSLIVYRKEENDLNILIDYAIPAYRDLKNSSFFYHLDAETLGLPPKSVFNVESDNPAHIKYLKKTGFTAHPERQNIFIRSIRQ